MKRISNSARVTVDRNSRIIYIDALKDSVSFVRLPQRLTMHSTMPFRYSDWAWTEVKHDCSDHTRQLKSPQRCLLLRLESGER
jgi:hypothetical protein